MPFSSDGDTIDFIYGVINWKDVGGAPEIPQVVRAELPPFDAQADEAAEDDLLELVDAIQPDEGVQVPFDPQPEEEAPAPVAHLSWEDGPLADPGPAIEDDEEPAGLEADAGLADRLWAARESAEVCKQADGRSRAALYRALGMA